MKTLHRSNFVHRRTASRGVSLVNIAIILVVAALLTSAALLYYSRYNTKTRVQNEIQTIADLKANMAAYASRVGGLDASNADLNSLVGQNFFPAQYVVKNGAGNFSVRNQWGGSITVDAANAQGQTADGDGISFFYDKVPVADCTELAGSLGNVASIVVVNLVVVKAAGAATNLESVASECAKKAGNTVSFTLVR